MKRDVADPFCHTGFPEPKSTDTAALWNHEVIEAHLAVRHVVDHVFIPWIYNKLVREGLHHAREHYKFD